MALVNTQWQSIGRVANSWLSIGKIDPNLVWVAVDWSEWHPSGTVALDWLPLDMFHICVMIAAGLHYFGTKGIITLDPPFVPTVCQQIMIFTRIGGLGLLLPWSLTNSGLWPHTPNVYTS